MRSFLLANTRLGLPIFGYQYGSEGPHVLILGGVHGDEPEGVTLAMALQAEFQQNFPFQLQMTLVPQFNADGIILHERTNGASVDLNRNLPTKDWTPVAASARYNPGPQPASEPENQGLLSFLEKNKIDFILSLHSWNPMININGDCDLVANKLSQMTGYHIADDIGYPTPGSLGTYAGQERKIPTITYEIQRDLQLNEVIRVHRPALIEGLKVLETKNKGKK